MSQRSRPCALIFSRDEVFARMLELELKDAAGAKMNIDAVRVSDISALPQECDLAVIDTDGLNDADSERIVALLSDSSSAVGAVLFGRSKPRLALHKELRTVFLRRPFDCAEFALSALDLLSGFSSLEESPSETEQKPSEERNELRFDATNNLFFYGEERLSLTETEHALLAALYGKRGDPVSRSELLLTVWGRETESKTNLTDVYIRYLREKLDDRFGVRLIFSVRGKGYMLK